jgi:hypothetical protein
MQVWTYLLYYWLPATDTLPTVTAFSCFPSFPRILNNNFHLIKEICLNASKTLIKISFHQLLLY